MSDTTRPMRAARRVDRVEPDQVVVVEFVMRRRRQLVAAGEDFHALQRLGRLAGRNAGDPRDQHVVLERAQRFEDEARARFLSVSGP